MRTFSFILFCLFFSMNIFATNGIVNDNIYSVNACTTGSIFDCRQSKFISIPTVEHTRIELEKLEERIKNLEEIEKRIIEKLDALGDLEGEAALNAVRANLKTIIQEEVKNALKESKSD